jgi:ABC-type sugar transport system ATPase subunit
MPLRHATIFQEPMVVPGLSVAENVIRQRTHNRMGWRSIRDAVLSASPKDLKSGPRIAIDPVRLWARSTAQKQIVEIARALIRRAGHRLDEPTAALSDEEAGRFAHPASAARRHRDPLRFASTRRVRGLADRSDPARRPPSRRCLRPRLRISQLIELMLGRS